MSANEAHGDEEAVDGVVGVEGVVGVGGVEGGKCEPISVVRYRVHADRSMMKDVKD